MPAIDGDWGWTTVELYGLSCVERVLLTLGLAGIERVWLPDAAPSPTVLASAMRRHNLPALARLDAAVPDHRLDGDLLLVRGGMLFNTVAFARACRAIAVAEVTAYFVTAGAERVDILALRPGATALVDARRPASLVWGAAQPAPGELYHRIVGANRSAPATEDFRLADKGGERRHVRVVRRATFPLVSWLAKRAVMPTAVTTLGFAVALAGCLLLVVGGYWTSVAGAAALYLAWVIDRIDGSLARLSFRASEAGRAIDTAVGRVANLCMFAALSWVVSRGLPVAAAGLWLALAGGALLATATGQRIEALNVTARRGWLWRLRETFEHLQQRDITLALVLLALAGRPGLFAWLLLALVHMFWLVDLSLLRRHRRGAPCGPPDSSA
jgi:phosphatidylglycerophosphate synthase